MEGLKTFARKEGRQGVGFVEKCEVAILYWSFSGNSS